VFGFPSGYEPRPPQTRSGLISCQSRAVRTR
jgi:hypothetical protein